jgi:hypothetical protein
VLFPREQQLSTLDQQGARTTYPAQSVRQHLMAQARTLSQLVARTSGSLKDALSRQLTLTQQEIPRQK